jgi:hypothetical protein
MICLVSWAPIPISISISISISFSPPARAPISHDADPVSLTVSLAFDLWIPLDTSALSRNFALLYMLFVVVFLLTKYYFNEKRKKKKKKKKKK